MELGPAPQLLIFGTKANFFGYTSGSNYFSFLEQVMLTPTFPDFSVPYRSTQLVFPKPLSHVIWRITQIR